VETEKRLIVFSLVPAHVFANGWPHVRDLITEIVALGSASWTLMAGGLSRRAEEAPRDGILRETGRLRNHGGQ
jgi:hypothetical protein